MRRFLSTTLTMLGLLGLVTPDAIESSRVLKGIDSYANPKKIPQKVKDKIVKTDMFTVATWSLRDNYDTSHIDWSIEYHLLHNLAGTLLLLGSNDKYYTYLAERWEADSEAKELTFTLSSKARFSDGTPITASNVAFTFKRLLVTGSTHLALRKLLKGSENVKNISTDIPGIEVLDERKIRFRFTTYSTTILFLFTQPDGGILSPQQVNKATLAIEHWKISSGAYTLERSTSEENILRLNPYFLFKEDSIIPEMRLVAMKDNRAQLEALLKHEIQCIINYEFDSEAGYVKASRDESIDIIPKYLCATTLLFLNKRLPIFQEKRNRQAVARWVINELGDMRPIKDDRYYRTARQYILPTVIGDVSKDEFENQTSGFPRQLSCAPGRHDLLKSLVSVSDSNFQRVVDLFRKHGFDITEHDELKVAAEVKAQLQERTMFNIWSMYVDEKEIFDVVEYMDQEGDFFLDNRERIMALNHQLADTNDKAAKVGLMREINRLIIDDAVIIPLYHFVDVNLTDHRYKLFDDNEFTASPRLWNIRKKAPGRAKP